MQSAISVPRSQAIPWMTKKFTMFTPTMGSTETYSVGAGSVFPHV
jgi:hypothetical protein